MRTAKVAGIWEVVWMQKIRLAGVVRESVVDGPGIRIVFFAQGCSHHCPGCHNSETQDPHGGFEAPIEELVRQVAGLSLLNGVTFSGGEPFEQAEAFAVLGEYVRKRGLSVVTYTGYTFEELHRMSRTDGGVARLLAVSDILIDGPFVISERDLSLAFRGSRNQRVLDLPRSLAERRPVTLAI